MKNRKANADIYSTSFAVKSMEIKTVSVKRFDETKGEDVEVKEEFFTFKGYAATFNNIDFHDDIIEKGAFAQSLKGKTPKLLEQHNPFEYPVGVITEIYEDEKGLFVEASLPMADDRVSKRIAPQMRIGSLDSMSIGYRPIVAERDEKTGVRILKEVEVFEISLVTFPANDKAIITGVKSEFGIDDVESINTKKEFEDLLKSSGAFSRKACTYLASHFKNTQSDSGIASKERQSDSADLFKGELDGLVDSMKNLTKNMRL